MIDVYFIDLLDTWMVLRRSVIFTNIELTGHPLHAGALCLNFVL